MAADLASTPRSGLTTQLCGDAHLMNFGVFGSPDRRLVFDINDFDETHPGPWEWDVKRLAASFAIAGRDNGYPTKERKKVVLSVVAGYRSAMREFAAMTNLDVWYSRVDAATLLEQMKAQLDRRVAKRGEATVAKARTRDSMQALDKLTHIVDGERRIISDPPLIQPIEELAGGMERDQLMDWLRALLRRYRATLQSDRRHLLEEFQLVHAARKVVGVGSVGTSAWIVLMFGRDDADPLFLQAKEAQPSVLEEFVGPSRHVSNGERVVHGQHLMAAASDIFLGWITLEGLDGVYPRLLPPPAQGLERLRGRREAWIPRRWPYYGQVCGSTLARAHARSGDRDRDRRLPRWERRLRPGARRVLRGLRRPERTRLRRPRPSREGRPHHRPTRALTWRTEDLRPCAVCPAHGRLREH